MLFRSQAAPIDPLAQELQVHAASLRDIIESLRRPGHDPRENVSPPIIKKGLVKLADLKPGLELRGQVLNVVDFGVFIDIGLKDSGLVHISQLSTKFIRAPHEVITVGQVVTVWVLAVDSERSRVSLTMIAPGTPRRQPQRKPQPAPAEQPVARQEGAPSEVKQDRPPQPPTPVRKPVVPPRPPARKPRPQPILPPLPQSVLEGTEPARSFGELKRLWDARRKS